MAIWTAEIKELENLYNSIKSQLPELEKELIQLIRTADANVIMLYSRRCLEVIITDLCECELKRPRKTEPLKGIIDKLHKEEKIPSHIITSMYGLNELSAYGAHPKDFDPEQVKPVLNNLDVIIKWYLKYKDFRIVDNPISDEEKHDSRYLVEKSIIVLPFENMSSDPEQEYFSDGLTEEIISDLSHVHDLLVISRSSAMTFKGTKKTIPQIAQAVKVRYVLEGSVRKAGNNLRITAQLIDSVTDAHLWAEKYTGVLDDIFDIQEKVSRAIVGSLKLKLTAIENQKIASSPIPNVYAYECFLKARYEILKWTEEGLNNALILLQRGLDLVGENAVLLAGIGYVYFQFRNTGFRMDEITLQKAEDYSMRALKIDQESSTAHVVLALLKIWNGDRREVIDHFKQALASDPNNFDALIWFIAYCVFLGNTKVKMPLLERLLKVEPLHPMTFVINAFVYNADGKFDIALNSIHNAYERYPDDMLVRWYYALTLIYCNLVEEADLVINPFIKDAPDDMNAKMVFSLSLAFHHDTITALGILKDPKMEAWARPDLMASFFISESYSLHNLKSEAMDWLENAVNLGFTNYPLLNEYDPLIENIRGEERFKKLLERVKYEWENFEV